MKKLLLFVMLICTVSIFAHEVTANFDVASEEGMGLSFTRGDLWWGDGTYLVDFMITGTAGQPLDFTLCQAWKKVNLWDLADFQIGRNTLSFGRLTTSRGSRNLQIQRLQVAPVAWSFKLHKQFGKIHLYSDAVWPQVGAADAAGKIAYESDKLTVGVSGVMGTLSEWFKEDGDTEGSGYAFDVDYVLANFLRVSGQFTRELIGSEDNYYFIASYDPGFEIPYLGKRLGRVMYGEWRPYVGMISRTDAAGDGMGESNTFLGINFQSFEKSYIKLELNLDSDEDIDPSFLVQMGYCF